MRSTFRRIVASLGTVGLGLATTVVVGTIQPSIASAAASISTVAFKAPVHTSYNHAVGGGVWNTGGTTYVKGELQGTDFACNDYASFLLVLEVASSPNITAGLKAEVVVDFTLDATGQSGVALVPDTSAAHLAVNYPLTAGTLTTGTVDLGADGRLDAGFSPQTKPATSLKVATSPAPTTSRNRTIFTSGAKERLTFTVEGLTTNTDTVVRMDAKILCKAGASPTGNLQAALISVTASGTAGSPLTETINTGNQTVNFRGVGNLAGLTGTPAPNLDITKLIVAAGASCPVITASNYPPSGDTTLRVSNSTLSVKYCYYLKNTGTAAAYGVTVSDDNAVADRGSGSSFSVSLTGLTTIDGTSTLDDLAAGALAVGEATVTYASAGVYSNIATASATNMTTTSKASATMINEGIIAFNKTVLEPGVTDCVNGDRKKLVSSSTTESSQSITYCFAVTNYLAEDILNLTTLSVLDDKATPGNAADDAPAITSFSGLTTIDGTGTLNDLAINATVYASLTLTKSTATASYENTATLTLAGTGATSGAVSRTLTSKAKVEFSVVAATEEPEPTPVGGTPRLSVVKTQTSASPAKLGDTITYSIVVTNTGEVALDDVTVSDPNAVLGTCSPSNPVAQLRINLTITCTATHVVTTADEAAGKVLNTAIANGKSGGVSIPQTSSQVVETPVTKAGASTTTAPGGKKVGDTGTNRAGDQDPQTLPGTGYDTSGMLLGVWALVFGSLALIWSDRKRRA